MVCILSILCAFVNSTKHTVVLGYCTFFNQSQCLELGITGLYEQLASFIMDEVVLENGMFNILFISGQGIIVKTRLL
jgi:hypothetical protein